MAKRRKIVGYERSAVQARFMLECGHSAKITANDKRKTVPAKYKLCDKCK